ncbi:MAG: hypothetical protein ABI855_12740, partial [Bacteroidota bacterium]
MKKFLGTIIFFSFLSQLSAQNAKIDSLLTLHKTSKEDTNKVIILNSIGRELLNRQELERGLNYINDAKKLAEKLEYKKGIGQSIFNIGVYNFDLAKFHEALNFYLASLLIREKINDRKGIATSLNSIGFT